MANYWSGNCNKNNFSRGFPERTQRGFGFREDNGFSLNSFLQIEAISPKMKKDWLKI